MYFSGIYSNFRELLIGHIAKLNIRYRKTHDVAIKAEIDRLTTELAALPERWSFVERKQRSRF